ncbi:MAG: trigger factor [Gammaproteobacteria bacterium]|nr:trigger factor [Gammaproteobacteria bacterium]
MEVSVAQTQGLERRMTVGIPSEEIEKEVSKRLKSLSRQVKLDGFRPGKVPMGVVKRQYGSRVRLEVFEEVARTRFSAAVQQESLRIASTPRFEQINEGKAGELVEFAATFEVLPEISLAAAEALKVEKPVAELAEQDVDNMIDKLRAQKVAWDEADRPAEQGDRIVIDYHGVIDGEGFEGGSAEDVPVTLGDNGMIAGFEEGLLGVGAGEERVLELTFPDTYHVADLAGKPVSFTVKAKQVLQSRLPEVDEEFVKSFGTESGDTEAFRKEVGESTQRELDQRIKEKTKSNVMDALVAANTFELPNALVDEEIARMKKQLEDELSRRGMDPNSTDFPRAAFEDQARRKVALGLIFAEIANEHAIKASPDKVREMIESFAASYQDSDEVIKWYYQDRQRLSGVESLVFEDAVVEWVLENADVTEQATALDALMQEAK